LTAAILVAPLADGALVPAADLEIVFRRVVFARLIADGDMHLNNLAMVKIVEPGAKTFTWVRVAPPDNATYLFPQSCH
jgi:serine/threonine-protein kinase HipA